MFFWQHVYHSSFRFGTNTARKTSRNLAQCCTQVWPWQLDKLIRKIEELTKTLLKSVDFTIFKSVTFNWESVWCTKFCTFYNFSFHVESLIIRHKIFGFLLLGMAVKLAHLARDVKIVTRTPGVSFTSVLAPVSYTHLTLPTIYSV